MLKGLRSAKAFSVLSGGLDGGLNPQLSAHAFPREIEFVDELPKTPSGRIQRFILRNREIAKAQA